MQFTIADLWAHMGLFARLIVAAMLIMSMASVAVVVERVRVLGRGKRDSLEFAREFAAVLTRGELDAALVARANLGGYIGRVVAAGIAAYHASARDDADLAFESVARALERQSEREVHAMKRGQSMLGTVSSTAPFVGLLGTVLGIVNSFQLMAAAGSGGLATVSAGIAEALVTTALGLLVAIPSVMAFNALQTFIDARAVDIAETANELLDVVARQLRGSRGRPRRDSAHPSLRVS